MRNTPPPRLATKLLLSFLKAELAEEVLGDLDEKFNKLKNQKSNLRANLNYWYQVIHYFRLFAIRKSVSLSNHTTMFQHALLLSVRNFMRYKSAFFINVTGLSTGLACALLIWLWVNDELQMDKFHAHDKRLYQLYENAAQDNGIKTQLGLPDLVAETIITEMPEIKYSVAITPFQIFGKFLLINKENSLKAAGQYVSKDFFTVFSYPLVQGDAKHALEQKNSVVISSDLAIRLFKTTENVVGKMIDVQILNFSEPMLITGIFSGTPANSSEQFDFLLTFEAWKDLSAKVNRPINWDNHAPYAFVVLEENADIDQFNKKIKDYIKTKNPKTNVTLFAAPYTDHYLYGTYENGKQAGGRIEYVRLFSIIAFFILAIACINFMNLSTARASRRLKEVGVKKAIGAGRSTLIAQYLTESMLLTILSLFIAILLVALCIPTFNFVTGKQLALSFSPTLILSILAIALGTGLIAGSYPALYLSGFNVATILKGKINSSFGETFARKGLVIFQFSLSIILIVSVAVVYKQIEFVQSSNLGYDKDNIIVFSQDGAIASRQDAFLSEIRKVPGVVNAGALSGHLVTSNNTTSGVWWEGKSPDAIINFENVTVSYDLIETLGVKMKAGHSFSREFASEKDGLIFNEAAMEVMHIDDPIGKNVNLWGQTVPIIGVVKNFHFESLHAPVKPQFFRLQPSETLDIMVKTEPGNEREAVAGIAKVYAKFNPQLTFDYKFLDQDYQAQYVAEKRVSILSRYFAAFAILISCLGLFGLAAFTAERRIKEIGIRKVLGSSVTQIIILLTGEFTKIVVISIIISLPVSYYITKHWLDTFAFRIPLEVWFFAGAGIAALVVAWLTVGIQTLRAAKVNPTECLKQD